MPTGKPPRPPDVVDLVILPEAQEAEACLLGGLMLNPGKLDEIATILKADDFRNPDHAKIFRLLLQMQAEKAPIEPVTVQERVARGKMGADLFGGIAYVVELPDRAPSTANLDYYARLVRRWATARRGAHVAQETITRLVESHGEPEEVLAAASAALAALGEPVLTQGWVQGGDALADLLPEFGQIYDPSALQTGFEVLDQRAPFRAGQLIVLGARPSMGKTALALNITDNAAAAGLRVGIFSLEMTRRELIHRQLAAATGIPATRIARERPLKPDAMEAIAATIPAFKDRDLFIDDRAGVTIGEIEARARTLKKRVGGLDMLIVDYIGLINGDRGLEGEAEIGDISKRLKILAKELDCAVVVLSQLSRKMEERRDRWPILSDLRGSGSLEQDADTVLFLGLPPGTSPEIRTAGAEVWLIAAKVRSGQPFETPLRYEGPTYKFTERPSPPERRARNADDL